MATTKETDMTPITDAMDEEGVALWNFTLREIASIVALYTASLAEHSPTEAARLAVNEIMEG